MRILAIETSCDETAIALLDINGPLEIPDIKILGNSLISQINIHEKYGGVYPHLAKREHQKNLPIILENVLNDAGENLGNPDIDYIAVTQGPGLEPALWTGITFAQELGKKWSKPVVPVNHMEGHIWSVLYNKQTKVHELNLPALALLVSGGHTELVLVKDFGVYEIIGRTRDDAVGESFDKVARMLGLSYPGGPKISSLAKSHRDSGLELSFKFPRPMANSDNLDFSFSGLKTAVLYKIKAIDELTDGVKKEISRAFEEAAIDSLVIKTDKALKLYNRDIRTLIVAGGVSSNNYLAERFSKLMAEYPKLHLSIPPIELATDNAVMIALAAYVRITLGDNKQQDWTTEFRANGNLSFPTSSLD
jgi:N6-L-threonylcarbamoyladenine synthase